MMSTGLVLLANGADSVPPEDVPSEIEFLNTSKIKYGEEYEIAFSKEQMEQIVRNFERGVLGRGVPVNRDHPRMRFAPTEAYGWVKEMRLEVEEKDGEMTMARLFATINWTKEGREMVASGAYKYTSIGAYLDKTSHEDGKTKQGMVLFELSLTNDPAFVRLPEVLGGELAQFSKIVQNGVSLIKTGAKDMNEIELQKQINEKEAQIIALNKELEAAKSTLGTTQKEVLELKKQAVLDQAKVELAERTAKLDKLILDNKMTPGQKEAALELTGAEFKGFLTAIELNQKAYAKGSDKDVTLNRGIEENFNSPDEEVLKLAEELQAKDKSLTLTEAMDRVLASNPELEKRFNNARE